MTCVRLPQGFFPDAAEAMPNPRTEGSCCPSSLVNSQLSSAGGWCILLPLHVKMLFYPKVKDLFSVLVLEPPCAWIPQNQTMQMLAVDPCVLESPHKFFLRMKQKLQQQQKGTWHCS